MPIISTPTPGWCWNTYPSVVWMASMPLARSPNPMAFTRARCSDWVVTGASGRKSSPLFSIQWSFTATFAYEKNGSSDGRSANESEALGVAVGANASTSARARYRRVSTASGWNVVGP